MKMNIAGQIVLHQRRKEEKAAKARRRALAKPKQTAEERSAKIAACKVKQDTKRYNRWHQYSTSIACNPLRTIGINV